MKRSGITFFSFLLFTTIILFVSLVASGQSTEQNFPTPITSNEINGTIRVRDIGDPRSTRYFYAFEGGQGDIFINVVTKNFSGDIDVFTAEALRPLTKMVIFADSGNNETGRLIYLRKSERLILRIEGRSPNDDPASYRIKFGGSFVALAENEENGAPTVQSSAGEGSSGIRVNAVGTIVEVIPRSKPTPIALENIDPVVPIARSGQKNKAETEKQEVEVSKEQEKTNSRSTKPVVVVTEAPEVATIFGAGKRSDDTRPEKASEVKSQSPPKSSARPKGKVVKAAAEPAEAIADPLASIRLIVQLKTGDIFERPMSEVLKFSVDKGILTVIAKDGKISKYSIFDVAKVTIE